MIHNTVPYNIYIMLARSKELQPTFTSPFLPLIPGLNRMYLNSLAGTEAIELTSEGEDWYHKWQVSSPSWGRSDHLKGSVLNV